MNRRIRLVFSTAVTLSIFAILIFGCDTDTFQGKAPPADMEMQWTAQGYADALTFVNAHVAEARGEVTGEGLTSLPAAKNQADAEISTAHTLYKEAWVAWAKKKGLPAKEVARSYDAALKQVKKARAEGISVKKILAHSRYSEAQNTYLRRVVEAVRAAQNKGQSMQKLSRTLLAIGEQALNELGEKAHPITNLVATVVGSAKYAKQARRAAHANLRANAVVAQPDATSQQSPACDPALAPAYSDYYNYWQNVWQRTQGWFIGCVPGFGLGALFGGVGAPIGCWALGTIGAEIAGRAYAGTARQEMIRAQKQWCQKCMLDNPQATRYCQLFLGAG